MTLKRPLLMQAAGADPTFSYSALDHRAMYDALVTTEGVISGLKAVQRAAGANFSVDVGAGFCVIAGDDVANQGKYLCQSTAVENVAIPSPPVSGSRIHRVIARVKDEAHEGTWSTYEWTLECLEDTGSGTPALPDSAITLALVTVASGASNVSTGNIADGRGVAQGLPGRPYQAASASDYPANPQLGDRVHRTDISPIEYVWDGATWRMDAGAAVINKARPGDASGRTSTTPTADDVLTATILGSVSYDLNMVLFYTADANGDFEFELDPPNNGTVHASAIGLPASSTGTSGPVTVDEVKEGSVPIGGGSGATVMTITITGKVWGGDGGTFALNWSRNGGTGTTVLCAHSKMTLTPVGT